MFDSDRNIIIAFADVFKEFFILQENLYTIKKQKAIREKAYYLWEEAGRPSFKDEEFYYAAEKEFSGV